MASDVPTLAALNSSLLVREKQLPGLLGLSRTSIRRAMERGNFPRCLRIGGCIAWRRADLEAWVAAGCPATGARAAVGAKGRETTRG